MGFASEQPANPAAGSDEDSTTGDRPIELRHQVPNSSIEVVESGRYFPSDVVIGILSILPVKTLLRFKSVCTNWDAMISKNPYLVSMHRKSDSNNPATEASLFCTYIEPGANGIRKSVLFHPDDDDSSNGARKQIDLDNHLLDRVICGAGNGVFLLGREYERHPDFRLWNPATREIRVLPNLPELKVLPCYCGVGVDLVADDIKVVLRCRCGYLDTTTTTLPLKFRATVFVYTLRNNCWRELEGCYPLQEGEGPSQLIYDVHAYFKGFLYWLFIQDCNDNNANYLIAFDMGSDVFHKIKCPFGAYLSSNLSVYCDSIAFFDVNINYGADLWLLSRHDDGQWCWIKHSSVPSFLEMASIIWYSFIGQTPKQLVLYDTGSREYKVLSDNWWYVDKLQIYRESLVCFKG